MGSQDDHRKERLEQENRELRSTIEAMCAMGRSSLNELAVGGQQGGPGPGAQPRV